MPSEYEALVAALKLTDIPFAEYGWKTRPEGAYGVVSLEMEDGNFFGDGRKVDQSWEGSVDVFFPRLAQRDEMMSTVEEILDEICGGSWEINSFSHEQAAGLFHIEWVFWALDEAEDQE